MYKGLGIRPITDFESEIGLEPLNGHFNYFLLQKLNSRLIVIGTVNPKNEGLWIP